jgi:hypothetical protein
MSTIHKREYLTDTRIEAAMDFRPDGQTIILYDQSTDKRGERAGAVSGLEIRIGARAATWRYIRDTVDHGKRRYIKRTLGHFDRGEPRPGDKPLRARWHMDVKTARLEAEKSAGKAASGEVIEGPRSGRRFKAAFADYLIYLREQSEDKGKPPRWMKRVAQIGNALLLPAFGEWTLLELSTRRAELGDGRESVESWYMRIRKGRLTQANHAMRILRAVYLREAGRDTNNSLPSGPKNLPTSAVKLRRERWQQQTDKDKPGMGARDLVAWFQAWRKLPPLRKAYHLTNLLTGARPGELARTPWANLDTNPRVRLLTIGNAKMGNNIPIPLSSAIARCLQVARDHAPKGEKSGLIFPGCEQAGHHETGLPKGGRGHALRRTYKTLCLEMKIGDEMSSYLQGHIPEGVSMGYALRQVLLKGRTLRGLQADISRQVLALLKADPFKFMRDPGGAPAASLPDRASVAQAQHGQGAHELVRPPSLASRVVG